MAEKKLFAEIISHTIQPETVVAMGAKLCYSSSGIQDLYIETKSKEQDAYINRLNEMGHLSPVEHASFTFGIEGVSRALLAQITRHRIASYSVQSQRYVQQDNGKDGFGYIVPQAIVLKGEGAVEEYKLQMAQISQWYTDWVEILGESYIEDARFVLPNAAETKMLVTMNARELIHFFSLRCCERSQWEIRALAWTMRGLVEELAPALFEKSGPSCINGKCSEGSMSCRKQAFVKDRMQRLKLFARAHSSNRDYATMLCEWASQNTMNEDFKDSSKSEWNFQIKDN